MAKDRPRAKEMKQIYWEVGSGLESPRNEERRTLPRKTWKRTVEEEAIEFWTTWSEIKRKVWRQFTAALCSTTKSKRNWWWWWRQQKSYQTDITFSQLQNKHFCI